MHSYIKIEVKQLHKAKNIIRRTQVTKPALLNRNGSSSKDESKCEMKNAYILSLNALPPQIHEKIPLFFVLPIFMFCNDAVPRRSPLSRFAPRRRRGPALRSAYLFPDLSLATWLPPTSPRLDGTLSY